MTTDEHVTLVPGSECDARLCAPQIGALEATHHVDVVDNTRHPRIDRPARAALHRLPGRFAVAGLSRGGLIALGIVRQASERVTGLALLERRLDRVRRHAAESTPATDASTTRTTR